MAEAEGGLNSCSATCYLTVAITGSNVKKPVFKPTAASGVYTRGKRWFEKKKKKKLIACVGIRGHIYYMNKKRQFLNSLWPFCMIKINLALKNRSFATQCQLISNDAKI